MQSTKQIIANNILELRKSKSMTQAELAEKLNYTPKAISKWERGESVPEIDTLIKITEIFNVTLDYLVTENAIEHKTDFIKPKIKRVNDIIYSALAVSIVWILATIIFVYVNQSTDKIPWIIFTFAVPASALVVGLLSAKKRSRKFLFITWSILLWTGLTSIFLILLPSQNQAWLIYLIGIPSQITLILWSKIIKI